MVRTAIPSKINVSLWIDVMNKPANLISVGLDHHFIISFRIDNSNGSTVCIDEVIVDIRLDVI